MIKVMFKAFFATTMLFSSAYGMQAAAVQTRQRSESDVLREETETYIRESRAKMHAIPTGTDGLSAMQILCNTVLRQQLAANIAQQEKYLKDSLAEKKADQAAVRASAVAEAMPDASTTTSAMPRMTPTTSQPSHNASAGTAAAPAQDPVLPTQAQEVQSKRRSAKRHEAGVSVLVRERFKNRFVEAYRKSEFAKALEVHLDANSNAHQNVNDIAINAFIEAYTDGSFDATHAMMRDIDAELQKCRGGKAGLFFYNAYNAAWYKKIYREARSKLSAERLLLDACVACLEQHKDNPELVSVLGMIQAYLSQNEHEGAHFLMNIALNQYRAGHHKYFYQIYTNPRRTLCILLAAVIAGYCAYSYYTRDY